MERVNIILLCFVFVFVKLWVLSDEVGSFIGAKLADSKSNSQFRLIKNILGIPPLSRTCFVGCALRVLGLVFQWPKNLKP